MESCRLALGLTLGQENVDGNGTCRSCAGRAQVSSFELSGKIMVMNADFALGKSFFLTKLLKADYSLALLHTLK